MKQGEDEMRRMHSYTPRDKRLSCDGEKICLCIGVEGCPATIREKDDKITFSLTSAARLFSSSILSRMYDILRGNEDKDIEWNTPGDVAPTKLSEYMKNNSINSTRITIRDFKNLITYLRDRVPAPAYVEVWWHEMPYNLMLNEELTKLSGEFDPPLVRKYKRKGKCTETECRHVHEPAGVQECKPEAPEMEQPDMFEEAGVFIDGDKKDTCADTNTFRESLQHVVQEHNKQALKKAATGIKEDTDMLLGAGCSHNDVVSKYLCLSEGEAEIIAPKSVRNSIHISGRPLAEEKPVCNPVVTPSTQTRPVNSCTITTTLYYPSGMPLTVLCRILDAIGLTDRVREIGKGSFTYDVTVAGPDKGMNLVEAQRIDMQLQDDWRRAVQRE